eukprot:5254800-Prymnesium_polylepis.1
MLERATDAVLALPPGMAPCRALPPACSPHARHRHRRLAFARARCTHTCRATPKQAFSRTLRADAGT